MAANLFFSPVDFSRYNADETLPHRFERMLERLPINDKLEGKSVAIKMHVGRSVGYTTIPPLFVRILVEHIKKVGGKPFVCDQEVDDAEARGYTQAFLGCPVVAVCGQLGKYFYTRQVDYKTFHEVDVAGHIADADFMIDLSHVKGHGACGYGGACKNIAMGCVTDRTRAQIHSLEGGLVWDESKCIHCEECVQGCNHNANSFKDGKYDIFYHNCTFCQHCVKVCPTGAIVMDDNRYDDFQYGMALCTSEVLKTFEPGHVYYINFLMDITALCDCWGMSTPPLVPDIGILAGDDIVAIERASLDMIKVENFMPIGAPTGTQLSGKGHLFEQLHGRDPFVQLRQLAHHGLGSEEYTLTEVR
nr:DUF362 domain-containing protein [bacterium]